MDQSLSSSSLSSSPFAIAVVLAGGYGTRIQHLLPNLPKPMAEVCGKPFLEWVLRYLQVQGIEQALLSTGYLGEKIADYFEAQPLPSLRVSCVRETKPLGTAGGFVHAVQQCPSQPGAWLITNGDSLVCADLRDFFEALADPAIDGVMLGVTVPDTTRYGSLICDEQGHLLTFAEKRPGSGMVNGGVYLFRHGVLAQFPSQIPLGFEQDVFPQLLRQGIKIQVVSVVAPFLDIGTPESLPQAEAFISQNRDRFFPATEKPEAKRGANSALSYGFE